METIHTPFGVIYQSPDREWFSGSRQQYDAAVAWASARRLYHPVEVTAAIRLLERLRAEATAEYPNHDWLRRVFNHAIDHLRGFGPDCAYGSAVEHCI